MEYIKTRNIAKILKGNKYVASEINSFLGFKMLLGLVPNNVPKISDGYFPNCMIFFSPSARREGVIHSPKRYSENGHRAAVPTPRFSLD